MCKISIACSAYRDNGFCLFFLKKNNKTTYRNGFERTIKDLLVTGILYRLVTITFSINIPNIKEEVPRYDL